MEIDYNELYGVEPEEVEGANESEAAELTEGTEGANTEGEGAKDRDAADPGDNDEDDAGGDDDDPSGDDGDTQSGSAKEPQSKEVRAGYAKARREAEAKLDAEKNRHREEMDQLIRSLGLKDASGKLIETKEEYDSYSEERRGEELKTQLRRSGVDPQVLGDYVVELPAVKAALKAVEAEKAKTRQMEIKAAIDEEIRRIGELDPAVKSVDDLKSRPYYKAAYDLVASGEVRSIYTAVKLLTEEDRIRQIAEGSARNAAVKAASKSHMVPTASRGAGMVSVPAEVLDQYRKLFPSASDSEIQKMYNEEIK